MRNIMVTHNDLDGAGCAILFKTVFPGGDYYCVGYEKIDETICRLLDEAMGSKEQISMMITDISPNSQETVDKINACLQVYGNSITLLDHHITAEERFGGEFWAHFDGSMCGTAITQEYLMAHNDTKAADISRYSELVAIINDYDLWKHQNPISKHMNTIFRWLGPDRFVQRCLYSLKPGELDPMEIQYIRMEDDARERYINDVIKHGLFDIKTQHGRGAFFFAESYPNDIAEEVRGRRMPFDFVGVVNMKSGKISLRSCDPECDVAKIAAAYGGGGHRAAAGFEIDVEDAMDQLMREVVS